MSFKYGTLCIILKKKINTREFIAQRFRRSCSLGWEELGLRLVLGEELGLGLERARAGRSWARLGQGLNLGPGLALGLAFGLALGPRTRWWSYDR